MKQKNIYMDKNMTPCKCGCLGYSTDEIDRKIVYICINCQYATHPHRYPILAKWEWNRHE